MEFLLKHLVLLVIVLLSFMEHQEVLAALLRAPQKVADERKLQNGVNPDGVGGDCVDGTSCPHGHCVCGQCATEDGKHLWNHPCKNHDMCYHGFCSGKGKQKRNCGGVCKPFIEEGGSCESDYSCWGADAKCVDGKCTKEKRDNWPNSGVGGDCVDGASCPHGQCVCGQCAPEDGKHLWYHPCENDDMCARGFCSGKAKDKKKCGGVCKPFIHEGQEGRSCNRHYECWPADAKCIDGKCTEYLNCDRYYEERKQEEERDWMRDEHDWWMHEHEWMRGNRGPE